MGTTIQRKLRMVMDIENQRVELRAISEVARLESLEVIENRMLCRPIKVLDLCAGVSGTYCTLSELGFTIEQWHAVETDTLTAAVAEKAFPAVETIAKDVTDFSPQQAYDVVIAGPPCQPWSRASGKARGFGDKRSNAFRQCARMIREVMVRNPCPAYMLENVKISPHLFHEAEMQEDLLQCATGRRTPFNLINALDLGAPQSRSRRVASNVLNMDDARRRKPIDADVLLESLGHKLVKNAAGVAPCIMARGPNTHAPVCTIETETGRKGFAPPEVLEKLQGYPVGITKAFNSLHVSREEREKMMGNAFHSVLAEEVFSTWRPHDMRSTGSERKAMYIGSTLVSREPQPTMLEAKLHAMTDEQLSKWMDDQLVGYVQPRLKLKVKSEETAPHQVPNRSRYQTPQKLQASVLASIRQKVKSWSMRVVPYNYKQRISMLFTKDKKRIDPETGLQALRFLTDLRAVNSSIDYSGHWKQWMPTIEEMRRSIPIWAKRFACEDVKDAFEHVILDEEDWHMLTVAPPVRLKQSDFTDEELLSWGHSAEEIAAIRESDDLLLQWRHCPQGLSAIAPFWNVFLSHGLNAIIIFRNKWLSWMACFVDDLLIFS